LNFLDTLYDEEGENIYDVAGHIQ